MIISPPPPPPTRAEVNAYIKTVRAPLVADRVLASQRVKDLDAIQAGLRNGVPPADVLQQVKNFLLPPPGIRIERIVTVDDTGDERWWGSLDEIAAEYPDVIF